MQRDPEQTEVQFLNRFAQLQNKRILEIGCGNGRMTWRYAEQTNSVVGIDPDPARLAVALQDRPKALANTVSFFQAHAQELPFASATFDGVILAWSL